MKFAILRIQKLKSVVAVKRSLKHAFREQDTPNADRERTPNNTHIGAGSSLEAINKFNAGLPVKLRKNGVLCVEYLITASPEVMKGKTPDEQNAFFKDSLQWLREKHGVENVVYAGIHRDETTPHMYAYVLPKDEKGNLNAFKFFGGREALSAMQDDFMLKVGFKNGLERGLKHSKAKHQDIRQYYSKINNKTPPIASIAIPSKGLFEREAAYQKKVLGAVNEIVAPRLSALGAKAQATDDAMARARAFEQAKLEADTARLKAERLLTEVKTVAIAEAQAFYALKLIASDKRAREMEVKLTDQSKTIANLENLSKEFNKKFVQLLGGDVQRINEVRQSILDARQKQQQEKIRQQVEKQTEKPAEPNKGRGR